MPTIPHIALFKKHSGKIVGSALLFWLLIGFFVYATEWIATHYFGMKAIDPIEQKQYLLRWVLWLLLTPIIIVLALRVNIGNTRLFWFILLHILLGTILLALEFMAELAIIKPMAEIFYHRPVQLGELMIPFLLKYFAYVINYFLIVGMVNIYVYMKSLQAAQKDLMQSALQNRELKYRLTLTQLQTLKMQIQPHFLFNAHHAIVGLIIRKENDKAAHMLTRLSELLRISLEQQEKEFVRLEEELQVIGLYLSIQQVRFGDRFSYTSDIASDAAMMRLPYFLLQPIVENAVIHGIEKTDEAANLHIAAVVEQQQLQIRISNTGTLVQGGRKGLGIGLQNVKERLQQYYDDEASFYLTEEPAGTILAQINLPAHDE